MSASSQVSKNFAVLSLGQVASKVFAFLITIYIAKVLLPERFGAVIFASGTLLYATLLLDFGFEQYGPIAIGRGDSDIRKLVGNVLTWRCIFLVPAMTAFFLVANLIPVPAFTRLVIHLYGLSLFTNAVDIGWVFLGTKRMWPSALSEIVTQLVVACGAFSLIHSPDQAIYMPLLFIGGRVLSVAFMLGFFIKSYGMIKFGIDSRYIAALLKKALPLWGSQIMGMVLTNFDLMLVGIWLGASAAGVYGAATRLIWMPTTFAIAYTSALRPIMANSYVKGFGTVESFFNKMVRLSTALAAAIFVGAALMSTPIMVQVFGENYRSGSPVLALLALAFFVMLMRVNYRSVLQTYNMQIIDFKNICVAAVVNVILIVCLIPRIGISGAALGNVAAELTILILTYRATKHIIGHQSLGLHILKTLACCAAMALFILATPIIDSVYVKSILAALVYLAAMFVTGIITPKEVIALFQSLKPGPVATGRVVMIEEEFASLPQVALAKANAASTLDGQREFVRQK